MKRFFTACTAMLTIVFFVTAKAESPRPVMSLRGIIVEQRADVKSLESWNAPGDPYYVLKTAEGKTLVLRPSAKVGIEDFRKLTGRYATLNGYYTEGIRPDMPLEHIIEQVPVEPVFKTNSDGEWIETGRQVMKRGSGFVVLAMAKDPSTTVTIPGVLRDSEWAHASNRLALLIIDQHGQGRLMIVDAERKAATVEIAVPEAYRPSCFAWLGDDSGFLLGMAKPEKNADFTEENFYRYTFAGQRFDWIYPAIERQYADIFSIETDAGTTYWAAASAGEGHPDLAIYRDGETVLLTDVFPGSIAPVFWQDHRLWALTEAHLEFGFSREERARNPRFDQRKYPERDWGDVVVYRIDPVTKQAAPDNIGMTALETAMQTSHDHRYRSGLARNDGSFTLDIVPIP